MRERLGKILAVFVTILALSTAGILPCPAKAEYPDQDIRIIIPSSPGGGFDTFVRALAPLLEKRLANAVNVIPVNVAGAGGRRGARSVYQAKPDGYTIGVFNMPGLMIEGLKEKDADFSLDEITWLATINTENYGLFVKAGSQLSSVRALQTSAAPIKFSATGPSSSGYLATKISASLLGIENQVVTGYEGSTETLLAVVRGDVDAAVLNLSVSAPFLETGDITMLAYFGLAGDGRGRPANVPDATELGAPELAKIVIARMLGGPPGLPPNIRNFLERAILDAMSDPEFTMWLKKTGNEAQPQDAAASRRLIELMMDFYRGHLDLPREH